MNHRSSIKTRHSFTDAIEYQEEQDEEERSVAAAAAAQSDLTATYVAAPSRVVKVAISKRVAIPDRFRVDRCQRLPEYGPKILFFSGGSALFGLSSILKEYTHNSVHLITPFDSGGSSAEIREAFDMLSVGDLRNRLMALPDTSPSLGNPHVIQLFSHRLDKVDDGLAKDEFHQIILGKHPLARKVSLPMRSILLSHLKWFANRAPPTFDWKGASIGNLIITGCFLEHDRDIVTAIYLIWKLLGVKGVCRPLTGANLHIRTWYEDGTCEVGQHKMGKRSELKKIVKLDFVKSLLASNDDDDNDDAGDDDLARTCQIDVVSSKWVSSADVICFPMGSFFGSVLVNLLTEGVGQAIVQNHCPKIYIPNTGSDPEMYGHSLSECVQWIVDLVRNDIDREFETNGGNGAEAPVIPTSDILNFVLVDTRHCNYCVPMDICEVEILGITVIDVPLVADEARETAPREKSDYLDSTKVAEILITLGC